MDVTTIILFCYILSSTLINSTAVDTIRVHETIRDGETITSAGGEFELGFFSPGKSRNRYLGIWYKKISYGTVVWVANRDTPLKNTLGVVRITHKGIIMQTGNVSDGIIWSSNTSFISMKNPFVQLLDSGNLVLRDEDHHIQNVNKLIWQSFDYPGDNMLPGMKFGVDLITGLNRYPTSWRSADDPSKGSFTDRLDPNGVPQFFMSKGSTKWSRTGPWNGRQFSGYPKSKPNGIYTDEFIFNKKEIYYKFELINITSAVMRFIYTPNGELKILIWNYEDQIWIVYITLKVSDCDHYQLCGPYGICNINSSPRCECLKGFTPKFPEKWKGAEWSSSGCVRKKSLDCSTEADFVKYTSVKLPDTRHSWYDMRINLKECRRLCLKNCSCTAYTNADVRNGGSGCILWFGDLTDMKGYTEDGQNIYVRMPASELGNVTSPHIKKFQLYIIRKHYTASNIIFTLISDSSLMAMQWMVSSFIKLMKSFLQSVMDEH